MPVVINPRYLDAAKQDAYFFYDLCAKKLSLAVPGKAKFLNTWATYLGYRDWQTFTATTENAHKNATGSETISFEVISRFAADMVEPILSIVSDEQLILPLVGEDKEYFIEALNDFLVTNAEIPEQVLSLPEIITIISAAFQKRFSEHSDRQKILNNESSRTLSYGSVIVSQSYIPSLKQQFDKFSKEIDKIVENALTPIAIDKKKLETQWVSLLGYKNWDDLALACQTELRQHHFYPLPPEFIVELVQLTRLLLESAVENEDDYYPEYDPFITLLVEVFDNESLQALIQYVTSYANWEHEENWDEHYTEAMDFLSEHLDALIELLAARDGFGYTISETGVETDCNYKLEWKISSNVGREYGVNSEVFPFWTRDEISSRATDETTYLSVFDQTLDFGAIYEVEVSGIQYDDKNQKEELFFAGAHFINVNTIIETMGIDQFIHAMDMNRRFAGIFEATFGFHPVTLDAIMIRGRGFDKIVTNMYESINKKFGLDLQEGDPIPNIMVLDFAIKRSEKVNIHDILRSLLHANNTLFEGAVLAYVEPHPLQYSHYWKKQKDKTIQAISKRTIQEDTQKLRELFAKNGFSEINLSKDYATVMVRAAFDEPSYKYMIKLIDPNTIGKSPAETYVYKEESSMRNEVPFGIWLSADFSELETKGAEPPRLNHGSVNWMDLLLKLNKAFRPEHFGVQIRLCDDTIDPVTLLMKEKGILNGTIECYEFGDELQKKAKSSSEEIISVQAEWAKHHFLKDRTFAPPPAILPIVLSGDVVDIAKFVKQLRMLLNVKAETSSRFTARSPEDEGGVLSAEILAIFKESFGIHFLPTTMISCLVESKFK